jgi:GT2 family glycosyltransferase
MMAKAQVAIILVNWNQKEELHECLDSIRALSYKDFSILLVDNNSSDGSVELARNLLDSRIQILRNRRNLGFARANNQAIKIALKMGVDYIMLLNTDATIEQGGLTRMVAFMEEKRNVAAVSPLILFHQRKDVISYAGGIIDGNFRNFSHRGSLQTNRGQFNAIEKVDFITGCCVIFRAEVLREIGLFDEQFFMYFEDTDLSLRLRIKGHEIFFLPNVKVWHKISESGVSGKKFYYHYYMNRNRLLLIKKHCRRILIFEFIVTILKAIINLLRLRFKRGLGGAKGAVDFLLNRRGRL